MDASMRLGEPKGAFAEQLDVYSYVVGNESTPIENRMLRADYHLGSAAKVLYLMALPYLMPLADASVAQEATLIHKAVEYGRWAPEEDSVTRPLERDVMLEKEVLRRLEGAAAEELEDGMTGDLGNNLTSLVRRYGERAVMAIGAVTSSGKVAPEVISHVLRWLGRMQDARSFQLRFWLLKRDLISHSPVVRDGAALGLAALGSPLAIVALREAIERERFRGLRRDMQQVLEQLERGT
jgi:hypothetical protein